MNIQMDAGNRYTGCVRLNGVQSLPTPNSFKTIQLDRGIGDVFEADIAVAYQQGWRVVDATGLGIQIFLQLPDGTGATRALTPSQANALLAQGYVPVR